MPVKLSVIRDRNGRKTLIGRVRPGRYATVDDFTSRGHKNISIHVSPSDKSASIYEFHNGTYTTIRRPGVKYIPLDYFNKRNLDAVIHPGQSFEHKLTSKSQVKGRLVFNYLPSRRGARTSAGVRHH